MGKQRAPHAVMAEKRHGLPAVFIPRLYAVKAVIDYDKVKIFCKVCEKSTEIPARTRFDANDAIELDEINIE